MTETHRLMSSTPSCRSDVGSLDYAASLARWLSTSRGLVGHMTMIYCTSWKPSETVGVRFGRACTHPYPGRSVMWWPLHTTFYYPHPPPSELRRFSSPIHPSISPSIAQELMYRRLNTLPPLPARRYPSGELGSHSLSPYRV